MNNFKELIKDKLGKSPLIRFPVIAIVGPTGTGKTRSINALPPDETIILNIESKTLTFPNASLFVDSNVELQKESSKDYVDDWDSIITKALTAPNVKYIVIDSFTKYCEYLLDFSKAINKGYDIYNFYNARIFRFLDKLKMNDKKFVILLAIDEFVDLTASSGSKISARRMAVRGKEWEGKIEKEFSIVLFTDVKQDKEKSEYKFVTQTDGMTSAKTPEGMFKERLIANDLKLVCDAAEKYFKLSVKTTE